MTEKEEKELRLINRLYFILFIVGVIFMVCYILLLIWSIVTHEDNKSIYSIEQNKISSYNILYELRS